MSIKATSVSFWSALEKPKPEPEKELASAGPAGAGESLTTADVADFDRISRPEAAPYGFIEMGSVIGIARPGYLAHNDKGFSYSWEKEDAEISATLIYLREFGVKTIVSLSNREYHDSHDYYIEERWRELNNSEISHFHYIHNEDHLDCKEFSKSLGPNKGKFIRFHQIVDLAIREAGGKVAVYCGAGRGRTIGYLASLLVANNHKTPAEAVSLLVRGLNACKEIAIRSEVVANGSFEALQKLYESLKT